MLMAGSDGPKLGPLAARPHEEEIRVEEFRLALAQPGRRGLRPAIPVAQELLEGRVHRVGGGGIANLRLHHHQRNAVHKKYEVRNNTTFHAARSVDAKL